MSLIWSLLSSVLCLPNPAFTPKMVLTVSPRHIESDLRECRSTVLMMVVIRGAY